MLCYKDKSFCGLRDCKKFNDCPDALTEEVKEAANKWWGKKGAPISMMYQCSCFEEKIGAGNQSDPH
jgi:hypothetical protein